MSTRDMIEGWVRVKLTNNLRMYTSQIWQNFSCVCRRSMFPWKVHQIAWKQSLKSKRTDLCSCRRQKSSLRLNKCLSACSFIGAHYSASQAAAAMLKVFSLTIVENERLHFVFHKIPHPLNWVEINLFAIMSLDLTAITSSCTDSVWVLTVLTLFGFISLKQNCGFLVGSFLCLHNN